MEINQIWEQVLANIRQAIHSTVGYNIYIKDAVPVSLQNYIFTIAVGMEINKSMIESRYKGIIESALQKIIGEPVELHITVSSEPKEILQAEQQIIVKAENNLKPGLNDVNPKYTFENYVIGSSNEYATAAAISTAENPGYIYNPLFLYGNSGLGKTHLMHAIGNRILKKSPNMRIVYVSSERFTNDFINSVRDNKTEAFRQFYRQADVLLIDDVQFIARKEATQEEFFHTFNELYSQNKQIVLTSDRKPKDLITLEERLRTRFEQGLTIDITIPNYETRVAILKKKAEVHNAVISEEVFAYIADKIKSNIRELEGALLKLISLAEIQKTSITMDLTENALKSILSEEGAVKITTDTIMEKVCVFYNVSKNDLIGKIKTKNVALPRQVAMYLCKEMTNLNFGMIGKEFGNKDRTTVMHNVKKIEEDLSMNEELKNDIKYIMKDLQSIE
jgi:chromosomal replication initiator protein